LRIKDAVLRDYVFSFGDFCIYCKQKEKRSEKERRRAMDGFMILGIVLLAAGFLFVGIETLIPGFGAPGILGGCCLVAGVFLIADSVQEAVIIVAVVLLLLAVLIFTLVTLLAKGRLKTPIILNDKMNKEEGYISSTDLQYLVGKKGVVTTDLHPAGKVRIEDVEFDVISDGAFLEQGTQVEIYKISNSSLVVRKARQE
jgi:membrane-bound ClpP family serine protease